MNDELMQRARELLARWSLVGESETADTIRDLMAEVERLKQEATANAYKWTVEARRAEIAESRLLELASAEPVAYVDAGENALEWRETEWHNIALIRRPEMPHG